MPVSKNRRKSGSFRDKKFRIKSKDLKQQLLDEQIAHRETVRLLGLARGIIQIMKETMPYLSEKESRELALDINKMGTSTDILNLMSQRNIRFAKSLDPVEETEAE